MTLIPNDLANKYSVNIAWNIMFDTSRVHAKFKSLLQSLQDGLLCFHTTKQTVLGIPFQAFPLVKA